MEGCSIQIQVDKMKDPVQETLTQHFLAVLGFWLSTNAILT